MLLFTSVCQRSFGHDQALILPPDAHAHRLLAYGPRRRERHALARRQNRLKTDRRAGAVALREGRNHMKAVLLHRIIRIPGHIAEIDALALDRLQVPRQRRAAHGQTKHRCQNH